MIILGLLIFSFAYYYTLRTKERLMHTQMASLAYYLNAIKSQNSLNFSYS